jgi:hypothetical protein
MEILPNETLLHIFNYAFDGIKTYVDVSATCKWFNEVSKLHIIYSFSEYCIRNKKQHLLLKDIANKVSKYEEDSTLRSYTSLITSNVPYFDEDTIKVIIHSEYIEIEVSDNDYWSDCDIYLHNNLIKFYTYADYTPDPYYPNNSLLPDKRININSLHTFIKYTMAQCADHDNFDNSISKLLETLIKISDQLSGRQN